MARPGLGPRQAVADFQRQARRRKGSCPGRRRQRRYRHAVELGLHRILHQYLSTSQIDQGGANRAVVEGSRQHDGDCVAIDPIGGAGEHHID